MLPPVCFLQRGGFDGEFRNCDPTPFSFFEEQPGKSDLVPVK
jgi:hypothetical protein